MVDLVAVRQLAPTGVLRVGINMINFLLVSGVSPEGEPEGVAPDMARAIANILGVPVELIPFGSPGELADAATAGRWDIGLIGAEPTRAETIDFTSAYVEIEATYLVPPESSFQSIDEVDQPGVRIAVAARSAYDLWLKRHIQHASLIHADGFEATFERFVHEKLDAMAGLRTGLMADAVRLPGSRLLDGRFTAVQQAIGTPKGRPEAAAFLQTFVDDAKSSGRVARLIEKYEVKGLSVAP